MVTKRNKIVTENKAVFSSLMTDIAYMVDCKTLVYDHAYELSNQITKILPWLKDDEQNGIHMLHGPDAGNGWIRSTDDTIFSMYHDTPILLVEKWEDINKSLLEQTRAVFKNKPFQMQTLTPEYGRQKIWAAAEH